MILGAVLTIVALAAGGLVYLRFGPVPVATADTPFPMEEKIVHIALNARVDRETKKPPFGISEDGFEAGARAYKTECANCHGTPGHDVAYAKYMYPTAPQLWKRHGKSTVVGVSDDPPGDTYWKVAHGIRLTGMPAFNHILSDTQMWQVSLLMANADKPMPDPVMKILTSP